MTRPEQIAIVKHMTAKELDKKIKKLEKDTKILQRIYFIKLRYAGKSVEESATFVGITKNNGYIWQERWNESGYDGLVPRYAGGKPSKLSDEQKARLKEMIDKRDDWTTDEVRRLIQSEFGAEYTLKQVRVILRKMGAKYGKPLQHDYRRPKDAEEILKKTTASR